MHWKTFIGYILLSSQLCVDSLLSALYFFRSAADGADRIELCAALSLGGITPSIGRKSFDEDLKMINSKATV